jgi:flagellar hook-associated protein 1
MTSLSAALSNALSGLMVASGQSAVVSRNVSRATDETYSRRSVDLVWSRDGSARLGTYSRSTEQGLQDRVLKSTSQLGKNQTIASAVSRLSKIIGDPADGTSVSVGISQLQQSLRNYQNNSSSNIFAVTSISDARSLAGRLNAAAGAISSARSEANEGAKSSIAAINSLLSDLASTDLSIRNGKQGSDGYLDDLDKRDGILRDIAQEIGVRTVSKSDGGIALYTDSGITLFDVVPRRVEMRNEGPLLPGTAGAPIFVDGVQISGGNSTMSIRSGQLSAQLAIRDETTLTYEAQLDETARSLVTLFAESDQTTPPTLAPAAGLFTYDGAPSVPLAATQVPGLAAQISISSLFDDQAGGNPHFLRDGGSNGAAFQYNVGGLSGYQQRLQSLATSFDAPFTFSASAKLSSPATLKGFSEASASALAAENTRSGQVFDEVKATHQRWMEASLRVSGVNIDEEMATLLSLEKSYQASAKVMTTVDQMFAVLVGIVR